jgi:hypothetical protein
LLIECEPAGIPAHDQLLLIRRECCDVGEEILRLSHALRVLGLLGRFDDAETRSNRGLGGN